MKKLNNGELYSSIVIDQTTEQKIGKHFKDNGFRDPSDVLLINQTKNTLFVLIEPELFTEEIKQDLLKMTVKDIYDGHVYDLNPNLDDYVVTWEQGETHWETIHGFHIEINNAN